MFKNFNFLYLILALTLTFVSCKKEELKPINDNTVVENNAPFEGVNWVLSEARVYLENIDNGEKYVYDYFGGGVTEANTHIFGGYTGVTLDSIKQNYTTWFFQNGTFTLNGTDSWEYTDYNMTYSPIGLVGGTSRPIEVTHVDDESMTVTYHEAYGSNNGINYNYYSELTFVKAGVSCNDCQPSVGYGWVYGGVWNPSITATSSLNGTKWVVTRYNNGLSGNVYPNDTLEFISNTYYTINGSSQRAYTLNGVAGNNMKSLTLYSFTTLGGDYSGQVLGTFIDDWVINNSEFTDMFNVNNTVTVWMERIQ
jgi:hypothetical protein